MRLMVGLVFMKQGGQSFIRDTFKSKSVNLKLKFRCMPQELTIEQPSLLGQIVSEVEKLNEAEKKRLLIQLRKDDLINKTRSLDAVNGNVKTDAMTDDEADSFLSEQRKLRYERTKA